MVAPPGSLAPVAGSIEQPKSARCRAPSFNSGPNCIVKWIRLKSSKRTMPAGAQSDAPSSVISALEARSQFGQLLRRVDEEHRCFVIEKRGAPKAIILEIKGYIRLAAPEPEILRIIGERSKRNKTSKLSARRIEAIIRGARSEERGQHAPTQARR